MPRRSGKRLTPPEQAEANPVSPFSWPSRRRAAEAERAARRAATAGLERLRARTPKPSPSPPMPTPAHELREPVVHDEPVPYDEPVPQPGWPSAVEHADPPEEEAPEPVPVPWDAGLDELTEQLVAELRRDLGPEAF